MTTKTHLFNLKEEGLTYFRAIIESLYKVLDDTKINVIFSKEIIIFFGKSDLDLSVKVILPKSFFNEYTIEDNIFISLSALHIAKILERPTINSTVLSFFKLEESNKLLIEFVDTSISNFDVPIFIYDEKDQSILELDNDELYKTQVTLNKTKYGMPVLFRDQKFVDFNKDNGFELFVDPDRQLVRVTTALTDITYPKARTTIKGIELSILESLSGPRSKSIYDYDIIRNLVKLDPLESQINLSFGSEERLRISYIFFNDENCYFMVFMNSIIENQED